MHKQQHKVTQPWATSPWATSCKLSTLDLLSVCSTETFPTVKIRYLFVNSRLFYPVALKHTSISQSLCLCTPMPVHFPFILTMFQIRMPYQFSLHCRTSTFTSRTWHKTRHSCHHWSVRTVCISSRLPVELSTLQILSTWARWSLDNAINVVVYLSVLQDKLPTFMSIHRTNYLQHDRAPSHNTKPVTARLHKSG